MALFKRRAKTGETNELRVEVETWTRRISRVGTALDSLTAETRDIVVVTEGDERERGEVVSLLEYRQSTYVGVWTSLMYRLNPGGDEPVFVNEQGAPAPANGAAHSVWYEKLRGVGLLMDDITGKLLSPSIIVLPSGVVVNSLVSGLEWPPQYSLRSFAYSNEQIDEAIAREHAGRLAATQNGVRS